MCFQLEKLSIEKKCPENFQPTRALFSISQNQTIAVFPLQVIVVVFAKKCILKPVPRSSQFAEKLFN